MLINRLIFKPTLCIHMHADNITYIPNDIMFFPFHPVQNSSISLVSIFECSMEEDLQ